MVVVCQQPNYFPWLGYLEQCAIADTLVMLDSVQWIRRGMQHRARILPHPQVNKSQVYSSNVIPLSYSENQRETKFQWLTLPVQGHGHREKPFRDLKLDDQDNWPKRHWNTLQSVYGRRPYFKTQLEPFVRPWLEQAAQYKWLYDTTFQSTELCFKLLEISPRTAWSSNLSESGIKTERLVSLCNAVNGTVYYSGIASTRYIDLSQFRVAGIRVVWQHWRHPEYDQGRKERISHLSILDALANVPLDEIKKWLVPSPWGPFARSPEL